MAFALGGSGLRVSKAANLKVENLDGTGGYMHIVNGKGGKQRTDTLPKPVLVALEAHLKGRNVDRVEIKARYLPGRSIGCE